MAGVEGGQAAAALRRRAEKAHARMRKAGSGNAASLLASSARHFIVAIPLMERERPLAATDAFKASAKSEYAVRYLEEIGATPSAQNLAMVEQHMGIERNVKVNAAWKSRGSVSDCLYLSPAWPNQESRGGARGRAEAEDGSREPLNFAVVDATLVRLGEERLEKIRAQQVVRATTLQGPAQLIFGGQRARNAIAALERKFELESAGEDESLRLRYDSLEAACAGFARLEMAQKEAQRAQRSRNSRAAKPRRVARATVAARREEERKSNLFPRSAQVFPKRATVRPKQKDSKSKPLGRPVLRLGPAAAEELISTMELRARASRDQLTEWVQEFVPQHDKPTIVVELIELAARAAFDGCVLAALDDFDVTWDTPNEAQARQRRDDKAMAQFVTAYAKEKARLTSQWRDATAMVLPLTTLAIRICVDSLFLSHFAATCATLAQGTCGGAKSPTSTSGAAQIVGVVADSCGLTELCPLRLRYDEFICEVLDPGGYLRAATILRPNLN